MKKKTAITVIIPTIQVRLNILKRLLGILTEDPVVNQIILINNKPDIPITGDMVTDKVDVIVPRENLYVNESWNLGVSLAKNDKFLLMNDDLLVCKNFCSLVLETGILDKKSTGLVGASPSSIVMCGDKKRITVPKLKKDQKPEISPMYSYMYTGDWGISIFGKKSSYYQIPDDLKIIYGDNYLLYKNKINNKINYQIMNLPFHHIHSASCSAEDFTDVVGSDITNSTKYLPDEKSCN